MKINEKDLQKIIQQEIRENFSEQELSEINMLQRAWRAREIDLGQVWKAGRGKSQYDSAVKKLQNISSNALPKLKDEFQEIMDTIESSDKEYPQVRPLVQQVQKMLGNFDSKIKKVIPDHGSDEGDLSADEEGETPAQEQPVQEVFNFGAASDAVAAGRLKQDLGILKQKILKTYRQVKPLIRKIETFKPTSKEKQSDLETDEPQQQQPAKKPAAPAATQNQPDVATPAKSAETQAPAVQSQDSKSSTGAPGEATTSVTTPSAPGGPPIAGGDVRTEPITSSTDGSSASFSSEPATGGSYTAAEPNATQEPQADAAAPAAAAEPSKRKPGEGTRQQYLEKARAAEERGNAALAQHLRDMANKAPISENKKQLSYNKLYENWRRFTKG